MLLGAPLHALGGLGDRVRGVDGQLAKRSGEYAGARRKRLEA